MEEYIIFDEENVDWEQHSVTFKDKEEAEMFLENTRDDRNYIMVKIIKYKKKEK